MIKDIPLKEISIEKFTEFSKTKSGFFYKGLNLDNILRFQDEKNLEFKDVNEFHFTLLFPDTEEKDKNKNSKDNSDDIFYYDSFNDVELFDNIKDAYLNLLNENKKYILFVENKLENQLKKFKALKSDKNKNNDINNINLFLENLSKYKDHLTAIELNNLYYNKHYKKYETITQKSIFLPEQTFKEDDIFHKISMRMVFNDKNMTAFGVKNYKLVDSNYDFFDDLNFKNIDDFYNNEFVCTLNIELAEVLEEDKEHKNIFIYFSYNVKKKCLRMKKISDNERIFSNKEDINNYLDTVKNSLIKNIEKIKII